jgi:uncharacterized protein (TIGR03086 family)
MRTADDVDVAALHTVTEKLVESVTSIEINQWTLSTPCSDWNLTALIDHITGGNWFTVAILAGERAEDAMTAARERFGGRPASPDTAIESLENQVVALLRPGALDRTWNHVAGDLSGRQILRLRLHDLIVHSWDVDEALRPGATLPAGLVQWGLAELVRSDSLTTEHFGLVNVQVLRSPNEGSTAYLEVFGR